LTDRNANMESLKQDVNSFRGVLSRVMGLELAGSDWSPFLWISTVQAFFHSLGISPDCQIMRKTSVKYDLR